MSKKLINARRFTAPLLIAALALTACGSDGASDAAPTAETTADTATADTATADADESEPAESSAAESVEPAASGSYEKFCTTLEEYVQRPTDPDVADDPNDFQPVVDAAPPEIADDMQNLFAMTVKLSEFDEMTASDDEIAEFGSLLAEFEPLGVKMQAWSSENCPGYELE